MHRHGTTTRAEDCGATPEDEPTGPAARPGVSRPLRTVVRVLLALHLALLGWLALRPLPVSWTYPANLTPLATVQQAVSLGGWAGTRQLAGGLLPLAPFGVLLPLAGGRLRGPWLPSFLRTVGGAALLATALEIIEGWAPGHVLNVDDILLGTFGAAVCHLAVLPAARSLSRPRAAGPAAAADPAAQAGPAPEAGRPAAGPRGLRRPSARLAVPVPEQPRDRRAYAQAYERTVPGAGFGGLSPSGTSPRR
ncbi:VanZ family protein [Kitasatospora sp. MBT63]|uniref:VanZ family protein n=1 Tax=Kitasatospora sp. MBT63 TaxID=1444768 RepID=UPI000692035F|nr:VanZ family protein [Kitasatospora sp. MBT63]